MIGTKSAPVLSRPIVVTVALDVDDKVVPVLDVVWETAKTGELIGQSDKGTAAVVLL